MILARYLCLLVPIVALLAAALADRTRSGRAGAGLAFAAAVVGIAALHEIAAATGWYTFAPVDGAYRGMPVDLWLGWAVLWGPVPVLLRRFLPLPVALGLLLWLDVVAMPALDPLLVLGPRWLHGEVLGLLLVALPAQLLGRWTAAGQRLRPRVLLQMTLFTGLLLWLIPTAAFTLTDGGWDRLLTLPAPVLFLLGQTAFLISVPALAAVVEFTVRGGGTPFPWDPPRRLVTTGVYAYLANPMQVSSVLLLLLLAAATRSAGLATATVVAVAFSIAVAGPHERQDLISRYGEAWLDHRREVRDWWPRRTPYLGPVPGRLWLDDDCGPCSAVRDHLLRRSPVNLTIRPAPEYPETLWRARYEGADGYQADGVGAVARGLEHTGLLRAYIGWILLLPVLNGLAQVVADALIAPPHPALGQNVPS
jgi:protein-S-isoprenylcysteine O-methyltransferase Ste14